MKILQKQVIKKVFVDGHEIQDPRSVKFEATSNPEVVAVSIELTASSIEITDGVVQIQTAQAAIQNFEKAWNAAGKSGPVSVPPDNRPAIATNATKQYLCWNCGNWVANFYTSSSAVTCTHCLRVNLLDHPAVVDTQNPEKRRPAVRIDKDRKFVCWNCGVFMAGYRTICNAMQCSSCRLWNVIEHEKKS